MSDNTDFENSVLDSLRKIEENASGAQQNGGEANFFTVKQALSVLVGLIIVATGFAAWMLDQMDKKLEAQTAALERQIDLALSRGLESLETSLEQEFNSLRWASTPLAGGMGVYPVQSPDKGTIVWATDPEGKFHDIWIDTIERAISDGDVKLIDGSDLYLRDGLDYAPLIGKGADE